MAADTATTQPTQELDTNQNQTTIRQHLRDTILVMAWTRAAPLLNRSETRIWTLAGNEIDTEWSTGGQGWTRKAHALGKDLKGNRTRIEKV